MRHSGGDVVPFHGDHHPVSVVEGRKSRNLFNSRACIGKTGCEGVNEDGSVNIAPNKYLAITVPFSELFPDLEVGKTYRLQGWRVSGNESISRIIYLWGRRSVVTFGSTFTVTEADVSGNVALYNSSNSAAVQECPGVTIRYAVYEDLTLNGYEPYGTVIGTIFTPAESVKIGTELEFPNSYNHVAEVMMKGKSEQVQLSGKNLLDEHWLTLNPANSPRPFVWDEAEQAYVGVPSSITQWVLPIEWKENQRYTISAIAKRDEWDAGYNTGWGFGLHVFYVDGTYQYVGIANSLEYAPTTLTTKANNTIDYIKFTYNRNYVSYVKWLQIEEGTSATPYEPYVGGIPSPNPDYPQPITNIDSVEFVSRGRNLIPFPYMDSAKTQYGITFTPMQDGSILINGTATGTAVFNMFYNKDQKIKVKAGTYTHSMGTTGKSGYFYLTADRYEDGIYKDAQLTYSTRTFTFDKDSEIDSFRVLVKAGYTADNVVIKPMYELGTIAHPYEPHHSTTRTIDLQGNQLRSLPDGTYDELRVKRDGSVELVQVGYPFNSTIGAMNNNDLYPGWKSSAFNDEIGDGLNASVVGFSNIGGLRLSGDMAHRIGVNTRGRPGAVWFYESSFGMTQSEMIAKYPNTEVEMYIKRTEPKVIKLPSISPLPTYWPTTVIYDQDGNDISAFVKVVDDAPTAALVSVLSQL